MRSIRRQLLLALLGAMFMAMLIAGWATWRAARHEADALFDYHLRQIALSVRDQRIPDTRSFLADDGNVDYVIRIWDLTGLTVYYSKPHESLPELTQLGYSQAATGEGQWRVFALQRQGMTIAVAQPMRVRDRLAADAAWKTLRPFFFLLPAVGALVWALVGLGLRPLARLADSVRKRSPDSLTPLPETGLPAEIQPLTAALNDLLARLKNAFSAQRDFVADAAHELRTPLTALQLQAQLVERAPDEAGRRAALDDLKRGLQRASHTVSQLLTLARLEPGAAAMPMTRVDLVALAREAVVEHMRLAEARGIDLGLVAGEDEVFVAGDAEALRILLANLLTNALRHAPPGGRVDVACRRESGGSLAGSGQKSGQENARGSAQGGGHDGRSNGEPEGARDGRLGVAGGRRNARRGDEAPGTVILEVSDNGAGIPQAERERVFDRFYRRAGEQGAHGEGSGLGLAIVRAIAGRHGAAVSLHAAESGGLLARVKWQAPERAS